MVARICAISATALVFAVTCGGTGAATGPIAYSGPGVVDSSSVLGARVAPRLDPVAVTYLVDGRPLATAAVAPWRVELVPGDLSPGRHALRLEAVTRTGRRYRSRATVVRVARSRARVVDITPRTLAAGLRALKRGRVTVRFGPGRYELHDVQLGPGARVVGTPGAVIAAPRGSYSSIFIANSPGAVIAHVTLDGGGAGPGRGQAIAVGAGATHFRASDVRILDVRHAGVYVWGNFTDVMVEDSTISGDRLADAGVIVGLRDGGSRASVVRSRITGFRQHGINFALADYGRTDTGRYSLALDNSISDIDDPTRDNGTDEGGIWSGGADATIIGNVIRWATWDGIETVGSSSNVSIRNNTILNTRTGIYVEHSTNHSTIADNDIRNVETGINVEWRYQDVGSSDNAYHRNRIARATKAGIFVDVGSDRNSLRANQILGTRDAIVLQGASSNVVAGNVLCGRPGSRVVQQSGQWDNGSLASPADNRIFKNVIRPVC